jgi:hypothetical protein
LKTPPLELAAQRAQEMLRKPSIPSYHPSRSNVRRGCRIAVNEESGTVIGLSFFDKSSGLLVTSEGVTSVIDTNGIIESIRVEYPMVAAQTTKGIFLVNLESNERASIELPDVHWFVLARNMLYIYYAAKLRRVSTRHFPKRTLLLFSIILLAQFENDLAGEVLTNLGK